jgi:hypothetical protein
MMETCFRPDRRVRNHGVGVAEAFCRLCIRTYPAMLSHGFHDALRMDLEFAGT